METLLQQKTALFAGGAISEEAKDAFFQAIMKAYVECKEAAKKTYGHKDILQNRNDCPDFRTCTVLK